MPVTKDFLFALAAVAAKETLPRFRQTGVIDNKYLIGFDPVTEADRAAETAIRALIEKSFPEHGILGEEHGSVRLDHDHVWVIDPIDGTRAFISGLPVWGTLIGLKDKGIATLGLMSQPFTGELFFSPVVHGAVAGVLTYAMTALRGRALASGEFAKNR